MTERSIPRPPAAREGAPAVKVLVYATVPVLPPTQESRTDNNTSAAVSAACNIPQ